MVFEPLDVSQVDERRFWEEFGLLEKQLHKYEKRLVQNIDDPATQHQIQFIAFTPTELLPKRDQRPTIEINYLIKHIYLSYGSNKKELETALAASIGAMEYYDIVDDLVDGDVKDGHEVEVIVTNELLMPLFVRLLGEVGDQAVIHWADHAGQTVESWVAEMSSEPSLSSYRELIEQQSHLYGSVAGLAAIAAGADDTVVERATAIGQTYFQYEQLLLDLLQWKKSDSDPWNAWALADSCEARKWVDNKRSTFESLIEPFPADRRQLLSPLVATDVSTFLESLD